MTKITWRKLDDTEALQVGDFWCSADPNTPERQGEPDPYAPGARLAAVLYGRDVELLYYLKMTAIHMNEIGQTEHSKRIASGAHWRPVGFVTDEFEVSPSSNEERIIEPDL